MSLLVIYHRQKQILRLMSHLMNILLPFMASEDDNPHTQSKLIFTYSPVYSLFAHFLFVVAHSGDVLDSCEENIFPSSNLPRAKKFPFAGEIDRLMGMSKSAIQEEKKNISKSAIFFKGFTNSLRLLRKNEKC
ncbi:hypothetical protein C1646_340019 [Rhizophagus diaphanus]|nr:hypothetical protein C1646_340019 [Rhizophagus diaphanus] [Rhizophagus sp. MUCL 43196]